MEAQIIEQLMQEALLNVNIGFVLILMAIGFFIKYFPALDKVQNNLIPPVLLWVSLVISFIQEGFTIHAVTVAFVSSVLAIGIHQEGKNIFAPIISAFTSLLTSATVVLPFAGKDKTEITTTGSVVEEEVTENKTE